MQFALVGICLILRIGNWELGTGNWELGTSAPLPDPNNDSRITNTRITIFPLTLTCLTLTP